MRKKTSVAFLAVLGLLLFGCGKKTTKDIPTTTKTPTPVTTARPTTTEKQVKKYTVAVVNSIQNAGTISGAGQVEEGKSVTLTATPNDGYIFLGYYASAESTTALSTDTTYTVSNVQADVTITAKWAAKSFTLAVKTFSNVDPDDIVEFDDDSLGSVEYEVKEQYATGETIHLTATPATGYQFNGWYLVTPEGDHPISTDAEFDLTMYPSNATIKALFGTKKCTIELVANIEAAADELTIYTDVEGEFINQTLTTNYGTEVNIYTNQANDGYTFQGFYLLDENGEYDLDDLLSTDYYFYATDSAKYLAFYTANDYDLNINNITGGTVTYVEADETFQDDTALSVEFASTITLNAEAIEGYTFGGWYADSELENLISSDAEYAYTQTVANESNIWVKFVPNKIEINFIIPEEMDGMGTVTESGYFDYDSTVTFTATPAYGHVFLGWYVTYTDEETGETEDVKVSADGENSMDYEIITEDPMTFIAKFAVGQYQTEFCFNLEDLNDNDDLYDSFNATYSGTYTFNGTATIVAPEITGYIFKGFVFGDYAGDEYKDCPTNYLCETATFEFTQIYGESNTITAVYDRMSYRVWYDTTSTETISKAFTTVYYGKVETLEIPTTSVNGQVFDYWQYVDGEGNFVQLTNSLAVMLNPYTFTSDLHVRAKWSARDLTVIFDTDGGTDIPSVTVTYGNTVQDQKPDDPEKDGYTFVGWYNNDNQVWVWGTFTIVNDTTIYAHWTINEYTIAIESANTAAVTVNDHAVNGTYDYNTELELRANVETGYTFDGWYEGTTKISSDAIYTYNLPSHDVTLVAKYTVNKYKVIVKPYWWSNTSEYNWQDLSGITATVNGENSVAGVMVEYGTTFTIEITLNPDKPNQYLYGYYGNYISSGYINVEGTTTHITTLTLDLLMPAKNVTLNAEIKSNTRLLKVSKSSNTGTEGSNPTFTKKGNTTVYTSGSAYIEAERPVTLTANEIAGYTFTGWYVKGTNTKVSEQLEYTFNMPYSALDYEARYTENEYTFTVVKVVNETEGETTRTTISNNQVTYKTKPSPSVTAMTGYTFRGWFISGTTTCLSTNLTYASYTMPKSNVTIEAIFDINNYEVLFGYGISNTDWNLDAGTVNYDNNVYYYGDYNTTMSFEAEAYTGWTFKGYYQAPAEYSFDRANLSTYTLLSTDANYEYTITASDVTVFAVFEAKQYVIVYNENGGSIASDSAKVYMGDNHTITGNDLEIPTRQGSDFQGWKYTDTETGDSWFVTAEDGALINYYDFAKGIQIKAMWGDHLWSVLMETGTTASTDTKSYTVKVENNQLLNEQAEPYRKGYTFVGWFNQEEGGTEWNYSTPITSDTTIYAHWTVNKYYIRLDVGSNGVASYTYNFVGTDISGTASRFFNASDSETDILYEVEYGQVIQFRPTFNLGRQFYYWNIFKMRANHTQGDSYSNAWGLNWDFTYNYDFDVWIRLNYQTKSEMQYYNFTSTTTTCTITSLTTTGKSATTLIVPNYVTDMGVGAFAGNTVVTSITLPFTGQSRGANGNYANKTFTIIFGETSGTNLREVQPYWMNGTTHTAASKRYIPESLTTVTITNETAIADCAFENVGLNNIYINEGITSIGKYAFKNNMLYVDDSTSFELPSTLKTIGDWAFQDITDRDNCTMSEFIIPDSVTTIGQGALADNDINNLYIPFIGKTATSTGAEGIMTWFYLGATGTEYNYEVTQTWGTASGNVQTALVSEYLYRVYVSNAQTPTMKMGAFQNMTNLIQVEILSTKTTDIPLYFCDGCTALTAVTGDFFSNASIINAYAFRNCSALTNSDEDLGLNGQFVTKAYTFGSYSFYKCGLTYVKTVAASDITVNTHAFESSQLESFVINNVNLPYVWTYDYAFASSKLTQFSAPKEFHAGNHAFEGCTSLTEISCTKMATSNTTKKVIGDYAFAGCTSLTSFDIEYNIRNTGHSIFGDYAFSGCTSLATVVIYDITTIGTGIFKDCSSLSNLTIPFVGKDKNNTTANIQTSKAEYMFGYFFSEEENSNMFKETISGHNYYLPNVELSLTITNLSNLIPAYSFYGYSKLVKLDITGLATSTYSIGRSAFCNTGIKEEPTLPSGLVLIHEWAFSGTKIPTITLPDTVETIKNRAFYNISTLYAYVVDGTLNLPDNSNLVVEAYAFGSTGIHTLNVNKFSSLVGLAFQNCSRLVAVNFNYGTTATTFGTVDANVFLGCTNTNLVISYYGTKAQFTALISNGNLVSGWNVIKLASGTEPAVTKNVVSCEDGLLTIN